MIWRIAAIGAACVVLAAAWMATASWLFLTMAGVTVDNPWWAWWSYSQSIYADIWTRVYLIVSAAIPTIVLIAIVAIIVHAFFRSRDRRELYGNSEVADRREMARGGIGRTRRFF
jgi:hypothetical protein